MSFNTKLILIRFLFLTSITLVFSCSSEKRVVEKIALLNHQDNVQSLLMKVDFQRGFTNDTVGLKFNDYTIFDNILLTTTDILDFTEFVVKIYSLDGGEIAVSYYGKNTNGSDFFGKVKIIKTNITNTSLTIKINGDKFINIIELKKGKYVGVSRTSSNQIKIIQRDTHFFYD